MENHLCIVHSVWLWLASRVGEYQMLPLVNDDKGRTNGLGFVFMEVRRRRTTVLRLVEE